MAKTITNQIKIRHGTNIGSISAEEDDNFLFECFYDHPAVAEIQSTFSNKKFLLGRTGVGKTAILRHLQSGNNHVAEVDLHAMAMDYISNSDILRFISSLDVSLDLFYQTLWRHVLCLEYIRLRFKVTDESSSKITFENLKDHFRTDKTKQRALDYLSKHQGSFWVPIDETMKEVIQKLENKAALEFGAEIELFLANAGYARTLSKEARSKIQARARQVVNADLLADLHSVLKLLAEYDSKGSQRTYFILIDRLDEKWVDSKIKYSMVWGLIESLKAFTAIKPLRIAVALRSDVLERVFNEINEDGFQREKYDEYCLPITWNASQLREVVESRISYLYKWQYTKNDVKFADIFRSNVGTVDPFNYMLERTLLRPRDIIAFINQCFSEAEEQTEVHAKVIRHAEGEYSRIRLKAIVDEWQSAFPTLKTVLEFIAGKPSVFLLADLLDQEIIDELVLKTASLESVRHDPVFLAAANYLESNSTNDGIEVIRTAISELYRIGVVGLKLSPNETYRYSHLNQPIVLSHLLNPATKVTVHKMLHLALNIQTNSSKKRTNK